MAVTASTPNYRYVRGTNDTTKVFAPASTMINPGDFIFSSGGTAYLGSTAAWSGAIYSTAASQQAYFVGVSRDQRISSDATSGAQILVDTRGVFTYPCAATGSGLDVGFWFTPAKDSAGNNMLDQTVTPAVSGSVDGYFRLVQYAPSGATNVLLSIQGVGVAATE
jgi:hypothetical protein